MELLYRLAEGMPEAIFDWNPIAIAERMTRSDDIAYCAFAYSYGNYCRPHFAERPLVYGNLVVLDAGRPLRSIVGGTGIAVTRHCETAEAAADFARYCSDPAVQSGLYTYSGGQPARREAWIDPQLDAFNGHFFSNTLESHEQALLRPRYDGYVPLQEEAGRPLQDFLRGQVTQKQAWQRINECYRQSLPDGKLPETQ
jgi:multiple sugar transport system substrate-binding protein